MADTSRYWEMMVLTAAGRLQRQTFPTAQQWFQQWFQPQFFPDLDAAPLPERDYQQRLWELTQPPDNNASIAQLCLRCWLSHQIEAACYQLARQFGETYSFTAQDLWPLTLDDDGQLSPTYASLAIQILTKYNPSQSALGTWASRLTKSHPPLNRFFMELGLYRISPWAILNDTRIAQLPKALPHLSPSELATAGQLLGAYHRVYRHDRLKQGQGRARRCADPTEEQLRQIIPHEAPNLVFSQLHELADQLRQYRIAVRRRTPLTQSLDSTESGIANLSVPASNDTEQAQDKFLQQYRTHFVATLDQAIEHSVHTYSSQYQKRKPPQDSVYRQALTLFHCQGLSMGVIAKQLGLTNQVKVTRLLQLKQFRTKVCIYWLNQLKEQVKTDVMQHVSADRLTQIAQQLDHILSEETKTAMAEAASEAQIPKNRTANSIFSRRLCETVSSSALSSSSIR
ncbi:hypothetical protein IQ260_09370 [Leptolyngbya cf. ectocarpi LEGE 11479]|uniref:Uncharacterized protein n=1 Tax=Leptolyngbya cf. ectocarpi LEGE 11479 TaxID=1828722 RepID=A0A928X0T8_LEPEC|nr:hypothetical protein [Leptolyngbya ectocarpi]MBE9066862.1 hypothetical protein [Leptolyngbya cf. ectocarpi LEGE 11479]